MLRIGSGELAPFLQASKDAVRLLRAGRQLSGGELPVQRILFQRDMMSGLDGVKPGQNLQGTALEGTSISESDAETLALFNSLFSALQPDQTIKPDEDTTDQLPVAAEFMAKSALSSPDDMTSLSLESQAGDTRLSNEEVMAFLSEAPTEEVDGLTRLLVVAGKIIESAEATDGTRKPEVVVMNDGPDVIDPHPASELTTATVVQALKIIRQVETGSALLDEGISLSELHAWVNAGRDANTDQHTSSSQQQPKQAGLMIPPSPQFIGPMPIVQQPNDNSNFIGPMPRAVRAQPSAAFVGPMPMIQQLHIEVPSSTTVATLEGPTAKSQGIIDDLPIQGARDSLLSPDGLSKTHAGQESLKAEANTVAKASSVLMPAHIKPDATNKAVTKKAAEMTGVVDRIPNTANSSTAASSTSTSGTIVNLGQLFSGGQDDGTGPGQGSGQGLGQGSGQQQGTQSGSPTQAPTDLLQATGRGAAGRDLAGRVMAHRLNMEQSGWPENMVRQLDSNLRSGVQTIRIVLEPRQLGRLNVELGLRNGRAAIRVGAETAEAARRLASARGQLGVMLENAGLRLASFQTSSVDLASGADNAGGNTAQQEQAGRDGESSSDKQVFSNIMNDVDPDDLPDEAKPRADETAVLSILA